MTGLSLSRLLRDFPNIRIDKVEYLTHMKRARREGIHSIPALVSGDRKLNGFYLSRKRLRQFLEAES